MNPLPDALAQRIALLHFLGRQCHAEADPAKRARKRDQVGRLRREFQEVLAAHLVLRPPAAETARLRRLARVARLIEALAALAIDRPPDAERLDEAAGFLHAAVQAVLHDASAEAARALEQLVRQRILGLARASLCPQPAVFGR